MHPFTPSPKATGYSSGTHTYRVAVTVTNRSNLTLDLSEGYRSGTGSGFFSQKVEGPHLPACPQKLQPGKSANCELAFTTENEVPTLQFDFSPSQYHKAADWRLTT